MLCAYVTNICCPPVAPTDQTPLKKTKIYTWRADREERAL